MASPLPAHNPAHPAPRLTGGIASGVGELFCSQPLGQPEAAPGKPEAAKGKPAAPKRPKYVGLLLCRRTADAVSAGCGGMTAQGMHGAPPLLQKLNVVRDFGTLQHPNNHGWAASWENWMETAFGASCLQAAVQTPGHPTPLPLLCIAGTPTVREGRGSLLASGIKLFTGLLAGLQQASVCAAVSFPCQSSGCWETTRSSQPSSRSLPCAQSQPACHTDSICCRNGAAGAGWCLPARWQRCDASAAPPGLTTGAAGHVGSTQRHRQAMPQLLHQLCLSSLVRSSARRLSTHSPSR